MEDNEELEMAPSRMQLNMQYPPPNIDTPCSRTRQHCSLFESLKKLDIFLQKTGLLSRVDLFVSAINYHRYNYQKSSCLSVHIAVVSAFPQQLSIYIMANYLLEF